MASDASGGQLSRRAEERLRQEEVIWLATVRRDGQPQTVPVWFLWEDGRQGTGQSRTMLIYSKPKQQKLRNIQANPRVALNFNSDATGDDIVWFEGRAEIVGDEPPATANAAYLAKYHAGIGRIGMTPERFAAAYAVAIRVRLTRARG